MAEPGGSRRVELAFEVDGDDDLRVLRGALLASRASELGEMQRRDLRLFAGYGTESARDGMTDEIAQRRRRLELLDRLLAAIERARSAEASPGG
jgi:hypothetical protein